jgi:NAD kinase
VWHVVSDEFVAGGHCGGSVVQTRWEDGSAVWDQSRFVVFHPSGSPPDPADLPPRHRLLPADGHLPTADVRAMVFNGGADAAEGFVPPAVADYIRRHGLFTSAIAPREVRTRFDRVRLKIVCGPQKDACDRAAAFRHLEHPDPNLILVLGGDGTMLHAIRQHWRLRLPFLGLNAGHLGHLMNEIISADLAGSEFVLHRMPMLRVDVEAADGHLTRGLAFNDAWVERDTGQGAWLKVEVNGETRLKKVVCDGLLVATPSGSSAYARAMGATSVPLSSPVLTLAGSNVFHPRFWKPLALPADTVVKMTSTGDPAKRPVRGFLDGLPLGRVRAMETRVSPVAAVELAFTPAFDLSARLLRSLFPPDDAGY